MNPIDKIYQAIFEKTAIANHSGEKLVLMMEREPIRQKDLFASEVESMAETARISNVVFLDFQVADYRWLPVLDMAYEKSLEAVLLQYANWQQKNPKEITLEQMCFPMMLDFVKETFSGAKGRLPSGFWFHATELYPMDWKQDLDSGFSELDLVDSVVSQMKNYVKAYQKRERVVDVLLQYGKHVKRQNSYDDLLNKKNLLAETYYCMGMFSDLDNVPEKIWNIFIEHVLPLCSEELLNSAENLKADLKSKEDAYQDYEKAIWNCIHENEISSSFLKKYKQEVKDAQRKLEQIREQIKLAIMKNVHETQWGYRLLPSGIDDTFESVTLKLDADEFLEDSQLVWMESKRCTGTELLFAGRAPLGIDMKKLLGHMQMELGFLVRRLEIKREWFHPEFFHMIPELKFQTDWCFPVSILLIKDITMRFCFDEITEPYMDIFMKHALRNNGFLCFRETFCSHKSICTMDETNVTCRMNWPMVAGYYIRDI